MARRFAVLVALVGLAGFAGSCGGGGSSPTAPPTGPTPTPSPAPAPTPTPSPTPTPDDGSEPPVTNNAPVTRVILRLYACFDTDNQPLECPDPVRQVVQEPIPVGWRLKLDVTGRDADNHETNGVSNGEGIEFVVSDPSMVDIHIRSNWQRDIRVLKPGPWEVYAVFDGVGSNSLGFTFVP
jgi:hypothetical protein